MQEKLVNFFDKAIQISFYFLFFLVPFIMYPHSYELFEFNKMWTTFGITLFIGFFWLAKMVLNGKIIFKRTPLDIPIALFLTSQIVSTIFSIDTHLSIWGYYSRFNGGLLSIFTYIFLYYAFVSNFRFRQEEEQKDIMPAKNKFVKLKTKNAPEQTSYSYLKIFSFVTGLIIFMLGIMLSAPSLEELAELNHQKPLFFVFGVILSFFLFYFSFSKNTLKNFILFNIFTASLVSIWGVMSHYGYDPTCYIFRGNFDVSCWTNSFQPKIRIFSTLGQPNWLAAYLAIIIPLSIAYIYENFIRTFKNLQNALSKISSHEVIWFILSGISITIIIISKIEPYVYSYFGKESTPLILSTIGFTFCSLYNFLMYRFSLNSRFPLIFSQLVVLITFYSSLLYTRSQSGFLAAIFSLIIFFNVYLLSELKKNVFPLKYLLLLFFNEVVFFALLISDLFLKSGEQITTILIFFLITFLFLIFQSSKKELFKVFKEKKSQLVTLAILLFFITAFFIGQPISKLDKFTFEGIKKNLNKNAISNQIIKKPNEDQGGSMEFGGITDSSKIRFIVWRGAIELFKKYPILGTGPETFAYSYYETRPEEHNLVSEWDYLYNKAHNEYLNFLSTTGIFGFLSYILIIFVFIYIALKTILRKVKERDNIIRIGILSSFISILITNFFGFSVVIINLYLFLIPALFFVFIHKNEDANESTLSENLLPLKLITIAILGLFVFYLETILLNYWKADQAFALGNNYDKVDEYTKGYEYLVDAVRLRKDEDLFKDELAVNLSAISLGLYQQKYATEAAEFADQAKALSDYVTSNHPRNITYLKSRMKVYYTLSNIDKQNLDEAIDSLEKAYLLAPTDAKIAFTLSLLYGQKNDTDKSIKVLEKAIQLKPDYRDAYFSLAATYIKIAKEEEKKDIIKAQSYKQKASNSLEFILKNLSKNDKEAKTLLETIK